MLEIQADAETIKELRATAPATIHKDEHGNEYVITDSGDIKQIRAAADTPKLYPSSLEVSTISSVAEYCLNNTDFVEPDSNFIMIKSINLIEVMSALDENAKRSTFVSAKAKPFEFPYEKYMESKEFLIRLRTSFAGSEEHQSIVGYISNIYSYKEVHTEDNSIESEIVIKTGSGTRAKVILKPFYMLAPICSFADLEISVPPRPYIVRAESSGPKDKPEEQSHKFALFPITAPQWEEDIKKNIATQLNSLLGNGINAITDGSAESAEKFLEPKWRVNY